MSKTASPRSVDESGSGTQIKQVPVSALRPGMFVCDFNANWMEHPFVSNRLLIRTEAEVEKIARCGIQTVFIDVRKGADVEAAPTLDEVVLASRQEMLDSATRHVEQEQSYEDCCRPPSAEEIRRARQVIKLATERRSYGGRQARQAGRCSGLARVGSRYLRSRHPEQQCHGARLPFAAPG